MIRQLLPCALAALFLVPSAGCSSSSVGGTTILEPSPDGLTLQGTYRRQSASTVLPTLILIHEPGGGSDRFAFNPIWDLLENQGYNLLAVDLRSHGDSDSAGAPDDLRLDPAGYPIDLGTWIDFIGERAEAGDPVSPDRIGVVGLGTSAALALAAVEVGLTNCAVAVSPRIEELDALRPGVAALVTAGDDDDSAGDDDDAASTMHDALFVAGNASGTPADDATALHELSDDAKQLLLVDGPHSGALILEDFDEARQAITAWCWDKL